MTVQTLLQGEGPRARSVFDRLAKHLGVASGQTLLASFERLTDEQEASIAKAIGPLLPSDPPASAPKTDAAPLTQRRTG
jgi:hypothetical protein